MLANGGLRPAIGDEPGLGLRGLPEKIESPLRDVVEQRVELPHRHGRHRTRLVRGTFRRRAAGGECEQRTAAGQQLVAASLLRRFLIAERPCARFSHRLLAQHTERCKTGVRAGRGRVRQARAFNCSKVVSASRRRAKTRGEPVHRIRADEHLPGAWRHRPFVLRIEHHELRGRESVNSTTVDWPAVEPHAPICRESLAVHRGRDLRPDVQLRHFVAGASADFRQPARAPTTCRARPIRAGTSSALSSKRVYERP